MSTDFRPEGYLLGIEEIDEQHGILFDYIHTLDNAIASGDRWVVVHHTLADLEHWTKIHFAVEESVMRIFRFPQVRPHLEQHKDFVSRIQVMKQKSLTEDIAQEASQFLHDWLMQHILVEDRKYADHFQSFAGDLPQPSGTAS